MTISDLFIYLLLLTLFMSQQHEGETDGSPGKTMTQKIQKGPVVVFTELGQHRHDASRALFHADFRLPQKWTS